MNEIKNGWLRAIDEALVVAHLGIASESDDYDTAKRKLGELIDWHVAVAVDPAVNGGRHLVPVELEPLTQRTIFGVAMATLTRIQRNDWTAKYDEVIEFARAIEAEVLRRVREENK